MNTRKFKVCLAEIRFTEIEVEAQDAIEAEESIRGVAPAVSFSTSPYVHRVQVCMPSPGKPGEFHWENAAR